MVDYRRQATREIVDIIRMHNRRGVFRTEIPQDPRAAEAPSHGMPLVALLALARRDAPTSSSSAELLNDASRRARADARLATAARSCFTIGPRSAP